MGMPDDYSYRLLTALAEELKLPLMHIARSAEMRGDSTSKIRADMALRLIDGYVLGLQTNNQLVLQLEPVTLASILYDAAEVLAPIAQERGYTLHLDVAGKYGPIVGDRRVLKQAFTLLGYELMSAPAEAQAAPTLTLATHRGKSGVIAGIFTNNAAVTTDAFRRAKVLMGSARQPIPAVSATSGAGIFIADSLLQSLSSSFKISRHHKQVGLAATLIPSRQLQLV